MGDEPIGPALDNYECEACRPRRALRCPNLVESDAHYRRLTEHDQVSFTNRNLVTASWEPLEILPNS